MLKDRSRRLAARAARSAAAFVLILASVLCIGCGRGGETEPGATEELQPATEPPASYNNVDTETAQRERILQLAAAFRQFGDYDIATGAEFAKMEHIIFCLYTDSDELEDCGREGFGRLSTEKADAALKGVFGSIEIMDVMRRKYDPDEDQTYYYSEGWYYIMRTDNSAYTYEVENVKRMDGEDGTEYHAAIVSVKREGENERDIIFTLIPDDTSVYRVAACDMSLWY